MFRTKPMCAVAIKHCYVDSGRIINTATWISRLFAYWSAYLFSTRWTYDISRQLTMVNTQTGRIPPGGHERACVGRGNKVGSRDPMTALRPKPAWQCLVLPAICPACLRSAQMKAGAAKLEITPSTPLWMSGYQSSPSVAPRPARSRHICRSRAEAHADLAALRPLC